MRAAAFCLTTAFCPTILSGATLVNAATPRDALLNAVQAQMAAPARRSTLVIEAGTTKITQVLEIVKPNRYHFVQTGGTGDPQEFYAIAKTIYIKSGTTWTTIAAPDIDAPSFMVLALQQGFFNAIGDVSLVGAETENGKPADHYSAKIQLKDSNGTIIGLSDIWIDSAFGLPLRVDFKGSLNSTAYQVHETFDYGTAIVIEPPS
jgi:hypothetical protein